MSKLPMDAVTDIISRLPVKTLLRFRCVSKPWCALIDSPKFIKTHLNRSLETKSNLTLLLSFWELYGVDLYSFNKVVKLDNPLKSSPIAAVLGCCNGLLLLSCDMKIEDTQDCKLEKKLAIYNPSTRKFLSLPTVPGRIKYPKDGIHSWFKNHGLGYDVMGDDYKVLWTVLIFSRESFRFRSEVRLYSLKSNSWRRIQDCPYLLCYTPLAVFSNGALHWLAKDEHEPLMPKLIVAFDFVDEKYRLLPEPECLPGYINMDVQAFEGCLSVTYYYVNDRADIWVMKDYGVKDSWSKLFSFAQPRIIYTSHVKPLAYSKSGGEVLFESDFSKLFWYDLTEKSVKEVKLRGIPKVFYADVCVGSLVQLYDCGRSDGGALKGKKELQDKKGKGKLQDKKAKKRDDFLSKGFKLVL